MLPSLIARGRSTDQKTLHDRFGPMPSTIICRFDYDPEKRELEVLFTTGRRYLYCEVPAEAAAAFRAAFAKGRHFNAHIRGRYPYRDCGAADEAA